MMPPMAGETEILTDVAFAPDAAGLRERLHLSSDGDAARLAELVDQARAVARPKAACKVAFVESRDDGGVVIDGIRFDSRVLRVNLARANRVFAYVATCGVELEEWSGSVADPFEHYWADAIKEGALGDALRAVNAHVDRRYRPGPTSSMNPGSLPDWPMEQQRPLFELLGDPTAAVGVQLTDSFLMVPNKSISGLRFPTEVGFESCQLCPREICPGRRAPYDKDLYGRRFAAKP